jgi:phosphatidylglycerophosphatase A
LTVDLSNGTNINSRQLRRILSDEFSEGFKELLKQTIQQLVELGLENNQLLIDVSITHITLSESTLFLGFRIALLQQCITSCREVLQNTTPVTDAMSFLNDGNLTST